MMEGVLMCDSTSSSRLEQELLLSIINTSTSTSNLDDFPMSGPPPIPIPHQQLSPRGQLPPQQSFHQYVSSSFQTTSTTRDPYGPVTPDAILYPLTSATNNFPITFDSSSPSFNTYFGQPGIPPGQVSLNLVEVKGESQDTKTTRKKRKKDECLSQEEKAKVRAKQCRKASRRYRQRKKNLMEELEQKVNVLIKEKESILKEKEAAVRLAQHLAYENDQLKEKQRQEAIEVEQLRQAYLVELDDRVRRIPPVPDSDIVEILNKMRDCCTRISGIGQCHLEMLLTMDVTKQLSTAGFFGTEKAKVELAEFPESIATFARKILTEVHTLNNAQRLRIQELLDEHYLSLERIRHIREELNADLSKFLHSTVPSSPDENMPTMLSSLATLEYLRENMRAESQQYEDTMDRMTAVLTPRQQAQFYLRVEFQHGAVIQLKNVWEALKANPQGNTSSNNMC